MALVQDLLDRLQSLSSQRLAWEHTWDVVSDYALPVQHRSGSTGAYGTRSRQGHDRLVSRGPLSTERGRRLYDATSVWAVDRLTAGLEALVSPQAEKWHELAADDFLSAGVESDEEKAWNERLRDYLFTVRYDPRSGFALNNQKALRSVAALGTSVVMVEETGYGANANPLRTPFTYRALPLGECFLGADARDVVDTNFRVFPLTARQAVKMFASRGGTLHASIVSAAASDTDRDKPFDFLHAVFPREERGSSRSTNRDSAWTSIYLDIGNRHLISESGFFEFPYIVQWWQQQEGSPYGESPVMLALADIVMLQQMAKQTLRASQQMGDPPLGLPSKGIMNRPDLNPRALNYGAVDRSGNLLVRPIVTAQNLPFAEEILRAKREQIKESLYVTLFQTLISEPNMTATEALIRSNEKGELLGPAGAKIQDGYARQVDREIAILGRLGAFGIGSHLEPPESLQGRTIGARFTSPLDRLRRTGELIAADRTVDRAFSAAARGRPEAVDMIDIDSYVRLSREIEGAPSRILLSAAEVDAIREERAAHEAERRTAETVRQIGEAGQALMPVAQEAAELLGDTTAAGSDALSPPDP